MLRARYNPREPVKSSIKPSASPDDMDAPASSPPPLSASSDVFFETRQFTRLAEAKASGLYPYFVPIESSTGTEVVVDGKRRVMIGSNNYLGLTHDPRVIAAAQAAIEKYGSACTGSRFLNGNTDLHDKIEVKLAE